MNKFLKQFQTRKFWFIFGIISIIAFGTSIRLWNLNENPPGLQYDEAYNGLDAIRAVENSDYKIFYTENNGREGLYINAIALSLKFLGTNNLSVRLVSALFGIFTLIGLFIRRISQKRGFPVLPSRAIRQLEVSFRQGLLLAVILLAALILQSQRILAWWHLIILVGLVGLAEWWLARR